MNVLLSNKVLTAVGFVLPVGTMWGEVTHFALLDTLATAAGEPRGRANRRRRYAAFCHRNQKLKINIVDSLIKLTMFSCKRRF